MRAFLDDKARKGSLATTYVANINKAQEGEQETKAKRQLGLRDVSPFPSSLDIESIDWKLTLCITMTLEIFPNP